MNTTPGTPRIERLLQDGVRSLAFPGAVWAVGDAGGTTAGGAVGLLDPARPDEPTRPDTLFDLASLTKVIAVWPVVGTLVEAGKLHLHTPLGAFWPEVAGHPLASVTPHQLLTHTAGLPLRANLRHLYGTDPQDVRDGVLREELRRRPGEAVEYTDRAALVLGYLAEHLTGRPLRELAADRIWGPLGMTETHYGPLPAAVAARCAPTEYDEETGTRLKGTVHDFSSRLLGGACGIAGAFSTAEDLGRFLAHVLGASAAPIGPSGPPGPSGPSGPSRPSSPFGPSGPSGPSGPFGAGWVAESLRIRTGELAPPRGLFWHVAPGTGVREDVWTHTGFTGTGMWVSPARGRWAVLLTNKLYFTRETGPVTTVRDAFRAAVFSAT
ncbi:serine hydrolase domain-containing protein [Streptomyces sp. NBC_01268]|uniref:serine hydrolase domain-containing protein n=1 Tax=Streptomyces sp. NBC_01268 TaxID=2903806 RepID=UPI002E31286E|nr:serine hydrolase domain-containing protein [Streptomyces sp. NBC_01268]